MDIVKVSQIVSTVGFPIVAFLLMFWYVTTESSENRKILNKLNAALTKLAERLDRAIESNGK